MLKFIATLIPFIKELFFDKKEEMEFTHPKFNTKKWVQYILFLILLTGTFLVSSRLLTITIKYVKLEELQTTLTETNTKLLEENEKLKENVKMITNEKEIIDKHCYKQSSKTVRN